MTCIGRGRGRRIRLGAIKEFSATSLHGFIATNVAPAATAKTDGWSAYSGAPGVNHDLDPLRFLEPQDLGALGLPRPAAPTPAILSRSVHLSLQPPSNPPRRSLLGIAARSELSPRNWSRARGTCPSVRFGQANHQRSGIRSPSSGAVAEILPNWSLVVAAMT